MTVKTKAGENRIEPLGDDEAKIARAECDEHGHDMTVAGPRTFIGRCRIGRGMRYCQRCRTAFFG
jgi:hypothetical protein